MKKIYSTPLINVTIFNHPCIMLDASENGETIIGGGGGVSDLGDGEIDGDAKNRGTWDNNGLW